jgi:hypothetical protein
MTGWRGRVPSLRGGIAAAAIQVDISMGAFLAIARMLYFFACASWAIAVQAAIPLESGG